jgi:hypothetical protein
MDYLIERFFDKKTEDTFFTRVVLLEQTDFELPFFVTYLKRHLPIQADLMGETKAEGPFAFKTRAAAEKCIEQLVRDLPGDGFKERE